MRRVGSRVAVPGEPETPTGEDVLSVANCVLEEDGAWWWVIFECELWKGMHPCYSAARVSVRTGRAEIMQVM